MLSSGIVAPSKAFPGAISPMPRAVALLLATTALALGVQNAAAQDKKKDEPLPPVAVALKTSDGVALAATYYPSRLGKDAAVVILVHAYEGNRSDFEVLSLALQRAGHAVIAPDLRGHGESTGASGEVRATDFDAMVRRDLEAVKRFLIEKNNAGELNIERLGMVGVEMGALIAINWAALDWSWPMLATGKQGQDVKALAVISPEWIYKGLKITEVMANPHVRSDLSFLIVTGERNPKLLQAAKRLHNALSRYHPKPPPQEADEKQTLWLKTPRTSLQGTKLMNERGLEVDQMILAFIELRLVNPPLAWNFRKSPLK
ncbi:MAG: alpha/beta fold hydrolase [Pirellulales bacterium]